ncbi:MAG TPA: Sapep family Mn(2+)-dependent dipeptidase [Clostridia bacterium]|nr:Sapep family Mn(2+)-dependent dipeptidase [Clostridia bacterium]
MKYFDTLLKNTMSLLAIDTVQGEAKEGAPFGEGNRQALDFVLGLAEGLGFKTKNLDGYVGYADFGDGEVFGILGHLDTVPIGKNWTTNPYGEVKDNIIYGRGALDDKAPILACLYAIKETADILSPKKKIRIIFGSNEESGWGCIDHYLKHEKMPSIGFSPDADFPVINCEKGIVNFKLSFPMPNGVEISGGDRPNVVPALCSATLNGSQYETTGKAAHAAHAYEGENAIVKMFDLLKELDPLFSKLSISFADSFGQGVGLKQGNDLDSALILNVGTVKTVENISGKFKTNTEVLCAEKLMEIVVDIRYPSSISEDTIRIKLSDQFKNAEITKTHFHLPLYVDKHHFLVETLLSTYNDIAKEDAEPLTIGGGTYARALPVGVAFGPVFPKHPLPIHCPDERLPLDQFKLMYEIYVEAIKRLCF